MSRNKGIADSTALLLFALVVVATFAFVYMFSLIPLADKVISIKAQAQLYVNVDDRGTALASFLQTRHDGLSYAEVLGDLAAKGHPEGIDSDPTATLQKFGAGLAVYHGGRLVKSYGSLEGYTVTADIALPGMKKGEVKVS